MDSENDASDFDYLMENICNTKTKNDYIDDNHNDKKIIQTRSGRVSRPLQFYDDNF